MISGILVRRIQIQLEILVMLFCSIVQTNSDMRTRLRFALVFSSQLLKVEEVKNHHNSILKLVNNTFSDRFSISCPQDHIHSVK